MKIKKLVALCLLLALCVTVLGFGFFGGEVANAAITNSIFKVNYNSSIATNSADGGLNVTFKTNSATGSVDSTNIIDLNKFAIEFTTLQSGHHYSELYFKFTNYENDKIGFVVTFEQNEENVDVKVYDDLNYVDVDDGTEEAFVTLDGITLTSHYLWLEYEAGIIKVRSKSILDEGTAEYSAYTNICVNKNTYAENPDFADVAQGNFAWVEENIGSVRPLKEANLQVGVLGQEKTGDDLGKDENGNAISPYTSIVNLLSVTNYYGTHTIGSTNLSVRPIVKCSLKEYRGKIIDGTENLFKHQDELGEWVLNDPFSYTGSSTDTSDDSFSGLVANVTAAEGQEYVFPFYTVALEKYESIDATEQKYNSSFDDVKFFVKSKNNNSETYEPVTEDFSKTSTSKVLAEGEGSTYVFVFTVKVGYDTEERYVSYAIKVYSIKDNAKPIVNEANFKQWATENTDFFTSRVIDAPESGSYTFPTITREDNEKYDIFTDTISEDVDLGASVDFNDFANLDIIVGFKLANSTENYEWSSDTSITFNQTGSHTIAYKVVDQSGNETVIFAFTVEVQDVTPPTISITSANQNKTMEVGKNLEVPTVSRYDNCSGINTDLNAHTVYYLDYTLNEDGYNTDASGALITSELKKVEDVTLTEGFKLTEEMISVSDSGESRPTFIIVYTATDNSGNVATGGTFGFITVTEKTSSDLTENPVNETLEIILIVVIAVLVVAILVLLFVNPQQKKSEARLQAMVEKEEARLKEEEQQK